MPRIGISYEDVAQVAQFLKESGKQPTIQRIREKLGTGSPNTILQHLTKWRNSQKITSTTTSTTPDLALTEFFNHQLESKVSVIKAEKDNEIERLKNNANSLEDQNTQLQKSIENLQAINEQLKGELKAIEKQLKQEQAARIEAEKIHTEQETVEALKTSIENIVTIALRGDTTKTRKTQKAKKAKTSKEKRSAD